MTNFTPHVSTLKTAAAMRWLAIAFVCLGLGLWGVWDFAVDIPTRDEKHARFQLAQAVTMALQEPDFTSEAYGERANAVRAQIAEAEASLSSAPAELPQREALLTELDALRDDLQTIHKDKQAAWATALAVFREAIERPRRTGQALSGWSAIAFTLSEPIINEFGSVAPPAAYDKWIQLVFIACLPFAPWYVGVYLKYRNRVYRLEEDGTLHLPGQPKPWPSDEIAAIDMSRWMSKSIAVVKHDDGRTVQLDDHLYKNLHIIIGQLAHRFQPDAWTIDAKPVKPEGGEDNNGSASDGDTDTDTGGDGDSHTDTASDEVRAAE